MKRILARALEEAEMHVLQQHKEERRPSSTATTTATTSIIQQDASFLSELSESEDDDKTIEMKYSNDSEPGPVAFMASHPF